MKRVVLMGLVIAVLAVVAAPLGLAMRTGEMAVTSHVAAAKTPGSGGNVGGGGSKSGSGTTLTKPDGCVQIALPIFGNNTCVQNSQGSGSAIILYLKDALKLISGAVGITVIIMIITSGIQYITSVGDPSNIKNAKNRLVNALIALLLFLMMFAILQFLVPGGIL